LRELGFIKYIPVIIMFGLAVLFQKSTADTLIKIRSLELFFPPLISLWIIPLFNNYVNEDTGEMFLSYPFSRKKQGAARVLLFTGIYLLLLYLSYIISISFDKSYWFYLFFMTVQCFFFAGISFLLIIKTRNIVVSMEIVLAYAGIQALDVNNTFLIIEVYFYNNIYGDPILLIIKVLMEMFLGSLFLVSGQRSFDKMVLN
jgi:hypothetical protein